MKLLLDENISHRIIPLLNDVFKPCLYTKKLSLKTDKEIWDYARKHRCTIVTFDSDFYGWQSLKGFPPKIIWLRSGNTSTHILAQKLNLHEKELLDFLRNNNEGVIEIF